MAHYGTVPEQTNARCANENGDVESSNGHLKKTIDQALLIRGSRDFPSRDDYMNFVEDVIADLNRGRQEPFSAEWIHVVHNGLAVQQMPRLIGVGRFAINYRRVIDSLARMPGSLENYKYREDMFPTSHFRIAYDALCDAHSEKVAVRKNLEILDLAAHESQGAVQDALRFQIQAGGTIDL